MANELIAAAPTHFVLSKLNLRRYLEIFILSLVILLAGDSLLRTGLSSILWLFAYASVASLILIYLRDFLDVFANNQSVLFIGYLAIFSSLWSVMPSVSLIAGVQLTITIIFGIYFGSRFNLSEILLIYAIASGATILLSSLNLNGLLGNSYSYVGGFLGIYTHKNLFAQQIGLFILCALPFAFMYQRARIYIYLTIIIALYFLWITKSVATLGAVMLFCSTSAVIFMLFANEITRFSITIFSLLCGLLTFLIFMNFNIGFWDILDSLGKDKTLTGRIDIWKVGFQHFKQDEYIGIGYGAFWKSPDYLSEVSLLRDSFGENVTAFHNFALEALVSFGIVGVFPMAAFCFTPIHRFYQLLHYKQRQSHWSVVCNAIAILGFCFFLALFGPLLMRQHETTMFLFPALAVAAQMEMVRKERGIS